MKLTKEQKRYLELHHLMRRYEKPHKKGNHHKTLETVYDAYLDISDTAWYDMTQHECDRLMRWIRAINK